MYAKNTIARRRPSGWIERRRYIQRLIEYLRVKVSKDAVVDEKLAPVTVPVLEKD